MNVFESEGVDVLVVEDDGAGLGLLEFGHEVEEGGLAHVGQSDNADLDGGLGVLVLTKRRQKRHQRWHSDRFLWRKQTT